MADLQIHQFRCRSDNFGVLIHDAEEGVTAAIDAPEAAAIERALSDTGWALTHILCTHHHFDHVEGIEPLKAATGCVVVGALKDAQRIPGIDIKLEEGEIYSFGGHDIHALESSGHTIGALSYHIPSAGLVFTGDTLFSLGCGRLFEGDASMMWHSIQKIMALPGETQIYCGHEYTLANGEFALTIEPGNKALQARLEEVRELLRAGKATLPSSVQREIDTNPFMRPDSPEVQKNLAMEGRSLEEVFAKIRSLKDRF